MRGRYLFAVRALLVVMALGWLASGLVAGQRAASETGAAAERWTPPRTSWADPDLQGVWNYSTNTPLERPERFADRERLTEEEIAALNEAAATAGDRPPPPGNPGTYNAAWFDRGVSTGRTSLITNPSNGRVPPLTPEGMKREAAVRAMTNMDSWENRGLSERCLSRPSLGPPIVPANYNNFLRVIQTPDRVVLFTEQPNIARIVTLDERPGLDPRIRLWLGDSRGRWDGNTLVIETTNFNRKAQFAGAGALAAGAGSDTMRLVERFTRVDADTLEYEFTVEDPVTFTAPWTALLPMKSTTEQIFEYACHEGNYTVVNALSGARAGERASGGR